VVSLAVVRGLVVSALILTSLFGLDASLFSKCRAWACSKTVNTEKTDPFAQFKDLHVIKFADKTFRFSEPLETIRIEVWFIKYLYGGSHRSLVGFLGRQNSMTLLHAAAAAKDTSHKVKRLLELGFPVNVPDLVRNSAGFAAPFPFYPK
jgi:hypothetical protein